MAPDAVEIRKVNGPFGIRFCTKTFTYDFASRFDEKGAFKGYRMAVTEYSQLYHAPNNDADKLSSLRRLLENQANPFANIFAQSDAEKAIQLEIESLVQKVDGWLAEFASIERESRDLH
ncbi:MAG: hypothetical protein Q9226_006112 [Calogaya cf. arnoldii]